tara:strand:+ start:5473 stop:6147 length:675 start_codon:yes stop_codon:yes gene_type:complete
MRVLLVEDDADIAGNIADYLSGSAHIVDIAYDGEDGLALAVSGDHDVILLDVNLPGVNGFELCRRLRSEHGLQTPVIFTTARGDLDGKLRGFDSGGWDYLVKPFSLAELSARIRALGLRQTGGSAVQVGALSYQPQARRLSIGDTPVYLPNIVFRLLTTLMSRYPEAVSRDRLVTAIWGEEEPDSSPLRSHISELRRHLGRLESGVELVSIRGHGYALNDSGGQ